VNNQYLPFLEKVLTPRRLNHSLGVMQVMEDLATVFGLDREKAQTIGILHDAGKDLSQSKIDKLLHDGNIQISHECEKDYVLYLHGPVGSFFIYQELGITDDLILEAIKSHTYYDGSSKYFDDPMSWCLRFSDILEPTRQWGQEKTMLDCVKQLRRLVYAGKMEEGAFIQISSLIKWFEEKGMPVHPNMRKIKQRLEESNGKFKS
jgi:predicted HD superfamily hydrolase involved in NAD metabolism